jgi:hypothetical protein
MIFALYRMGYHSRATVHGFRTTASTILNEHQFNRDWIEMQLAHVEGGVRAIYNAAEWLPGRRQMMCWWADYLDRAALDGAPPSAANESEGPGSPGPADEDWVNTRRGWTPRSQARQPAKRRGAGRV